MDYDYKLIHKLNLFSKVKHLIGKGFYIDTDGIIKKQQTNKSKI